MKIFLKVISTLAFLVIGYFTLIYFLTYGLNDFYEPDDVQLLLEQDKEIEFNIEVDKLCTYIIGIKFADGEHMDGRLIDYLGGKITELNVPMLLGVSVFDTNNNAIYENYKFGGKKIGYYYGKHKIKLIAGRLRLATGNYKIKIIVHNFQDSLAALKAYFFVNFIPKTTCG